MSFFTVIRWPKFAPDGGGSIGKFLWNWFLAGFDCRLMAMVAADCSGTWSCIIVGTDANPVEVILLLSASWVNRTKAEKLIACMLLSRCSGEEVLGCFSTTGVFSCSGSWLGFVVSNERNWMEVAAWLETTWVDWIEAPKVANCICLSTLGCARPQPFSSEGGLLPQWLSAGGFSYEVDLVDVVTWPVACWAGGMEASNLVTCFWFLLLAALVCSLSMVSQWLQAALAVTMDWGWSGALLPFYQWV